MDTGRFNVQLYGKRLSDGAIKPLHVFVTDLSMEDFNLLDPADRDKYMLVKIRIDGMISKKLAETYALQIAEQLNQFNIANLAVAKLT